MPVLMSTSSQATTLATRLSTWILVVGELPSPRFSSPVAIVCLRWSERHYHKIRCMFQKLTIRRTSA